MQIKSLLALAFLAVPNPAGLMAEDAHHPAPAPQAAPQAPAPAEAPTQAPSMGMMGMMPDMMSMMQTMADPSHHTEGRIAFLRAELAIAPDQETAWTAFAEAFRKNAALRAAKAGDHGHTPPDGVVGALIAEQHQLERQLEGLIALNAALGPLAEQLTPDQRRLLDQLLPHVGGLKAMMPMKGMAPASAP